MIQQGTFDMKNTNSQQVEIAITTDMAPKVKLLVYYTRPSDGEIVAAAVKFPIEGMFDNKVTELYKIHFLFVLELIQGLPLQYGFTLV